MIRIVIVVNGLKNKGVLFAEDSGSKTSISKRLGSRDLQAPVYLSDIKDLASQLFQSIEQEFEPEIYDIAMLTTDTGDAGNGKTKKTHSICVLIAENKRFDKSDKVVVAFIKKNQTDEQVNSRGGSQSASLGRMLEFAVRGVSGQAGMSDASGTFTKLKHFEDFDFSKLRTIDMRRKAYFELCDYAAKQIDINSNPSTVPAFSEKICLQLSKMYGVISSHELPMGVEYRDINNNNEKDPVHEKFRAKRFNQHSFETTLKGLVKTKDLYIEASMDCGKNIAIDGGTKLKYPCGSWFRIEKICDDDTINVKGPICDMREEDITKMKILKLRFKSFYVIEPEVEEDESPEVDE